MRRIKWTPMLALSHARATAEQLNLPPPEPNLGARIDGGRTLADIIDEGKVRRKQRRSTRCNCHWLPVVRAWSPPEFFCARSRAQLDPLDTYDIDAKEQASVKREQRRGRNLMLVECGGLKAATP